MATCAEFVQNLCRIETIISCVTRECVKVNPDLCGLNFLF